MDECPECGHYSLSYNVFEKKAICTHNSCNFSEEMPEDQYIIKYAEISKYALLPIWILEKIKREKNLPAQ